MSEHLHNQEDKPEIQLRWEFITPDQAQKYFDTNIDDNRSIRRKWVDTLKDLHLRGQFQITHQPIAFNQDGRLFDGQHRMLMVIEAKKPAWFLVARRIPLDVMLATDLGAKRKPNDQIIAMGGAIRPHTTHVSIARCMVSGTRVVPSPLAGTEEVMEFLSRHWDAIVFSLKYTHATGTKRGPVRAAIARAYYYLDHARLEEYMRVYCDMLANSPKDHAAVNFRLWCQKQENLHIVQGGTNDRVLLFRYAVASILAFFKGLQGKSLTPIPVDANPWRIPEDDDPRFSRRSSGHISKRGGRKDVETIERSDLASCLDM